MILQGQHAKRRSGSEGGDRAWAGPRGEGPRDPREVHSVHWYPPGGGGGPKKRHLVLYKLAGFSPADRRAWRPFFCLHSSPVTFQKCQKKCKFRPKMAIFAPKNPISGIFGPLFSPFFAKNAPGRGDPFFGGGPPGGGSGAAWGDPPLSGVPEETPGGWGKKNWRFFFGWKMSPTFFLTQLRWGTRPYNGIPELARPHDSFYDKNRHDATMALIGGLMPLLMATMLHRVAWLPLGVANGYKFL